MKREREGFRVTHRANVVRRILDLFSQEERNDRFKIRDPLLGTGEARFKETATVDPEILRH